MDEFVGLFQRWRERAGLSQNALARRMGVNPAYVNRLEHGGRGATNRELVEAAADALGLGAADPSLQLVASVLTDPALTDDEKAIFRLHVRLAALAWRPLAPDETLDETIASLYTSPK